MLEQFFQLGPIPINQMTGTYDLRLVALSYIVAVFASYIALDITGRLRDINNSHSITLLWIIGGAFAMGAGIWSMHFIGMLAFNMKMLMEYDPFWTILSMFVAVFSSAFALSLLAFKEIKLIYVICGGIILGFAIAAMHYTGMTAMTINMNIHYLPSLFILSIIIAVIAAEAALWLALKSTQVIPSVRFRLKFISAFVMGAGICGMHYTGMFAAIFTPKEASSHLADVIINPEVLAMSVGAVTLFILAVAFIASTYKESLNQQLLMTARQAGMAEVAASVLHNVGNVLNSVNVSAALLQEKINASKLSELSKLSQLLQENRQDMAGFFQNDERAAHLPAYLIKLSEYWENEKELLQSEASSLVKNIEHIKTIISTQQDLSRVNDVEQLLDIKSIVEESILISGLEQTHYKIKIERKYEKLKPILVDKVKLLQIIVNLLYNAKDAVLATSNQERLITLKTCHRGNSVIIEIIDNGIGIEKNNLIKIFAYGFTTKQTGHGFGLHASSISAKDLGGELKAKSAGLGKGATFILKLPYKCVS